MKNGIFSIFTFVFTSYVFADAEWFCVSSCKYYYRGPGIIRDDKEFIVQSVGSNIADAYYNLVENCKNEAKKYACNECSVIKTELIPNAPAQVCAKNFFEST